MEKIFISMATYAVPYTLSEAEEKSMERENNREMFIKIKDFDKALKFKSMEEKYGFWKIYFIWQDYEDWGMDVEFPKFLKDYQYYVQKELQKLIKGFLK